MTLEESPYSSTGTDDMSNDDQLGLVMVAQSKKMFNFPGQYSFSPADSSYVNDMVTGYLKASSEDEDIASDDLAFLTKVLVDFYDDSKDEVLSKQDRWKDDGYQAGYDFYQYLKDMVLS
jgi:hypothetical protein